MRPLNTIWTSVMWRQVDLARNSAPLGAPSGGIPTSADYACPSRRCKYFDRCNFMIVQVWQPREASAAGREPHAVPCRGQQTGQGKLQCIILDAILAHKTILAALLPVSGTHLGIARHAGKPAASASPRGTPRTEHSRGAQHTRPPAVPRPAAFPVPVLPAIPLGLTPG